MSQAVVACVDLSLGAADNGWMGFEPTYRLVQGVVLVLPYCRMRPSGSVIWVRLPLASYW
ncbi:MAG: hypothetical protein ACXWT1_13505 [Methylobacter sp.]